MEKKHVLVTTITSMAIMTPLHPGAMGDVVGSQVGLVTDLRSDEAVGLQDQHLHLIHGLRKEDVTKADWTSQLRRESPVGMHINNVHTV